MIKVNEKFFPTVLTFERTEEQTKEMKQFNDILLDPLFIGSAKSVLPQRQGFTPDGVSEPITELTYKLLAYIIAEGTAKEELEALQIPTVPVTWVEVAKSTDIDYLRYFWQFIRVHKADMDRRQRLRSFDDVEPEREWYKLESPNEITDDWHDTWDMKIHDCIKYVTEYYFHLVDLPKLLIPPTNVEEMMKEIMSDENTEIAAYNLNLVLTYVPQLLAFEIVDTFVYKAKGSTIAKVERGSDSMVYATEDKVSPYRYELLHTTVMGVDLAFIRAMCISTGRTFYLQVPRGLSLKDSVGTFVRMPKDNIPYLKELIRQGECYLPVFEDVELPNTGDIVPLTGEQYFNLISIES